MQRLDGTSNAESEALLKSLSMFGRADEYICMFPVPKQAMIHSLKFVAIQYSTWVCRQEHWVDATKIHLTRHQECKRKELSSLDNRKRVIPTANLRPLCDSGCILPAYCSFDAGKARERDRAPDISVGGVSPLFHFSSTIGFLEDVLSPSAGLRSCVFCSGKAARGCTLDDNLPSLILHPKRRDSGDDGSRPDGVAVRKAAGVKEARNAAFVLVAGGLGERLGYKGIKVALPRETTTGKCFLRHYIQSILSLQEASCKIEGECHTKIPFSIMTSDDTNALTIKLLESNSYFG
ncbi:uncharacterized protein LOC123443975 [Hordeum vulgare subsp. vulgare]|uniref:uncharacterized protein LOC123443975 n=1 Tax=Hordeum vulgare subsp. vulgare TaxID=112509 RepID=UPI001D1A552E|nr:uncharacterized protein LOC123443975 [Hordeum vulgare subsp. vulgare]